MPPPVLLFDHICAITGVVSQRSLNYEIYYGSERIEEPLIQRAPFWNVEAPQPAPEIPLSDDVFHSQDLSLRIHALTQEVLADEMRSVATPTCDADLDQELFNYFARDRHLPDPPRPSWYYSDARWKLKSLFFRRRAADPYDPLVSTLSLSARLLRPANIFDPEPRHSPTPHIYASKEGIRVSAPPSVNSIHLASLVADCSTNALPLWSLINKSAVCPKPRYVSFSSQIFSSPVIQRCV